MAQLHPQGLLAAYLAPPVLASALQLTPATAYPRGPLAYAWSAVVYAVCVPGIFALTLILYTAFFLRGDMLKLDLLTSLAPVVLMAVTLPLVKRKVSIRALPGIDRLSGLVMILAATFTTFIVLDRLRVMVVFHGSIWTMLALGVGLFLLFRFGWNRLTGSREPSPY